MDKEYFLSLFTVFVLTFHFFFVFSRTSINDFFKEIKKMIEFKVSLPFLCWCFQNVKMLVNSTDEQVLSKIPSYTLGTLDTLLHRLQKNTPIIDIGKNEILRMS